MEGGRQKRMGRILTAALFLSFLFLITVPLDPVKSDQSMERRDDVPLDIQDASIVFSAVDPMMVRAVSDASGRTDMVWSDSRDGNQEIYYIKIGKHGWKLHNDMRLTNSESNSTMPSVASTRDGTTIIVWCETDDNGMDLYMSSLVYDGKDMDLLMDGEIVEENVTSPTYPTLRSIGDGNALLAWSDTSDDSHSIRIAELDPFQGVVSGPIDVIRGTGEVRQIDIDRRTDGNWSLVWNGKYGTDNITDPNWGIYFSVFSGDGSIVNPPFRKSITSEGTEPDVLMVKNRTFIVFSSDRYSSSGVIMTVLDSHGKDIVDDLPITPSEWIGEDPSMEKDPEGNISLVWWDREDQWSIYRTQIDPEGDGMITETVYPLVKSVERCTGHPQQIIDGEGNLILPYIERGGNGLGIIRRVRPDLSIEKVRIERSGDPPIVGEEVVFDIQLINSWPYPIKDMGVGIDIYLDDEVSAREFTEIDLDASSDMEIEFKHTFMTQGGYELIFEIDPEGSITEMNETNNVHIMEIQVKEQSFDVESRCDSMGYLPGESGVSTLSISNTGTTDLTLNITVLGDVVQWFDERWRDVLLTMGDDIDLPFSFHVPPGVIAGEYMVLFEIRSSRMKEDLKMSHHQIPVRKIFDNVVDFDNYKRDIEPGTQQIISFEVTNKGNSPMNYMVSGENDAGLDLSIFDETLPYSIGPVEPGSSEIVEIKMMVPMNITPETSITIDLSIEGEEGGQRFSSKYNLTVSSMPMAVFDPAGGDDISIPEDWSPFDIELNITNQGNTRDIFRLEISDAPSMWTVDLVEPLGGEIALSPGENSTLIVHVIPDEIPVKGDHRITVQAKPSLRDDLRYSHSIDVNVGDRYGVELGKREAVLVPALGENQRILVTFTNTGNLDASYVINMEGPGSSGATIEPMGGSRVSLNESSSYQVQSRGTFNFWLEFTLPEDVSSERILVNVTCVDDTEVYDEMIITMDLPETEDGGTLMIIAGSALAVALLVILFIATRFMMNRREARKKDLMDEEFEEDEEL